MNSMVYPSCYKSTEQLLTVAGQDEALWISCSGPLLVDDGTENACLVNFVK